MPKDPLDDDIAATDKWLADAGFKRAKRPNGALNRARTTRDVRTTPRRPLAKPKNVEILTAPDWSWAWLQAGFSTRTSGVSSVFGGHDLNLGFGKHDPRENVDANRKLFLNTLGAPRKLVTLKQIHSSVIHVIRKAPEKTLVGDGAITIVRGLTLAILTADCVPVLMVDRKRKVIGAFHAGWRGTAKRIVEKGVGMMRMEYDSDPADIYAAIGPCIRQCCYAVGEEVVDEFHSQFAYAPELFRKVFDDDPIKRKYPLLFLTARAPGHSDLGPQIHLDLVEANRRQLLDAGLRAERIWASELCTSCRTDVLFSHRKEAGFTGRQMAAVALMG